MRRAAESMRTIPKPQSMLCSVFWVLLGLTLVAQQTTNRARDKNQAEGLVPEDIRRIDGTNYYVHVLDFWLHFAPTNSRPLPDWRELRGDVVRKYTNGVVMERHREVVRETASRDPLNRIGGFSRGASLDRSVRRYTPNDFGDMWLLENYPKQSSLRTGELLYVLAMRRGNVELTNSQGVKLTIARFDYGKPIVDSEFEKSKKP